LVVSRARAEGSISSYWKCAVRPTLVAATRMARIIRRSNAVLSTMGLRNLEAWVEERRVS